MRSVWAATLCFKDCGSAIRGKTFRSSKESPLQMCNVWSASIENSFPVARFCVDILRGEASLQGNAFPISDEVHSIPEVEDYQSIEW